MFYFVKSIDFSFLVFSDLEQELSEKNSSIQLLEREVNDGRRRCNELEEEIEIVNKEIGEVRVRENRSTSKKNFV